MTIAFDKANRVLQGIPSTERIVMQANGVIGLICVLTGVVGYLAFGPNGLSIGLLTGLLAAAGCYLLRRRCGSTAADSPRSRKKRNRSASRHTARLESLLAKAHLLADTFHDVYGARNYCLEIIRQTDKEDPLFIAAYDLFMRTISGRTDRLTTSTDRHAVGEIRIKHQADSQDEADVIRFPRSNSRQ